MNIQAPYLLFLGDAPDQLAAKVGQGVCDWRPERALGQFKMQNCQADLGLQNMTIAEAAEAGVKTLMIGVANRGGLISNAWVDVLSEALDNGMDIAAGLHNKLADIEVLKTKADKLGRQLFDVRHPNTSFPIATGEKRSGKRLLPVGTDCSVGKMYTALAIEKEMRERGLKADFRATGQTGILITGSGIPVDAVIADFIAGSVETLSPDNDDDHWDIIEGQGSLLHASYAGVTMGLIHGSQPDCLVLCHEPTRPHMRGLPAYAVPALDACMETHLRAAQLTNPNAKFVGISVNTSKMADDEAERYLAHVEEQHGLPAVDSVKHGMGRIVDLLV